MTDVTEGYEEPQRTFMQKAWLVFEHFRQRKIAYQLAANQPATQEMLADLAAFCRANTTCVALRADGSLDEKLTFVLEGRREVWLRIQQHLNLTTQQLYALYTGKQFNMGDD